MSTDNVIFFSPRKEPALGRARLSFNFCDQTGRPHGTSGLLRRYEEKDPDIAVIDIGEPFPVRVHISDFQLV